MIAGNLVEIRLPKTQSRKCLQKSNLWRYRAENVFGNLISTKLDCRGYQHTSSNNKTLNALLLAKVITGCHYT